MSVDVGMEGLQEAQAGNEKTIAALKPSGLMGRAVLYLTTQAHRHAIYATPWDSGGLRASHRMEVKGLRGQVFIDPGAVNPMQGNTRPSEYGERLHDQGMVPGVRGGIRAFYQYTVEVGGPSMMRAVEHMLNAGLP